MDRIRELRNPIRSYAWGSPTVIAELLGLPSPAPEPQAELWMGAHPSAPSRVVTDEGEVPLDAWIARDPEAVLGPRVAARFGGTLPFLMKVLVAARPLSIQAHPSAQQAREGFARENAAGIPLDAPQRNYRDANHKPELICSLGPFRALNRFRSPEAIRSGLEALGAVELAPALAALRDDGPRQGLARAFERLMGLRGEPLRRVLARAAELAGERGAEDAAWAWVGRLAGEYPGDLGVLAPLLLNLVELQPGEAMFLPSGELHSYLEGVGIEIMANSDNVLRGGLTPKHVDVPELIATLSFEAGEVARLRPEAQPDGAFRYAAPVAEFGLSRLEVAPASAHRAGAGRPVEILLCTDGRGRVVADDGREQRFARGTSLLVPAAAPGYRIEASDGAATLYKASAGSEGA